MSTQDAPTYMVNLHGSSPANGDAPCWEEQNSLEPGEEAAQRMTAQKTPEKQKLAAQEDIPLR